MLAEVALIGVLVSAECTYWTRSRVFYSAMRHAEKRPVMLLLVALPSITRVKRFVLVLIIGAIVNVAVVFIT